MPFLIHIQQRCDEMVKKNNVQEFKTRKLLTHAMSKLDEDTFIQLIHQGIEQGVDPFILIEEAAEGMTKVGAMYKAGHYFLADLIVAADIFQDMLRLVLEEKSAAPQSNTAPIIFGTVEEDIHDIGKNIAIGVLKGSGYQVLDLGVDVPAHKFAEAVKKTGSNLVCLSGLITPAYNSMKKTVKLLEKEGLRSGVSVIIGGLVNDAVMKYTGADYWVTNSVVAPDICGNILRSDSKTVLNL
ncbi:MAG: cobalamin-dependent protein [Thermincola sp.]|nr:cobalamin-dependent protein [Thermincola sp.]MDT3702505.1 cobalamin-dependent protein [Thermincola sp.]